MKVVELGDVADFIRGVTFKPVDVADTPRPSDVRCLRTKNVQDELDLDDVWAIDSSFVRRPEQFLQTGDVILGRRGEMGRCALVGAREQGWLLGTGSLALRLAYAVDGTFLTWVLRSPRTVRALGDQSV